MSVFSRLFLGVFQRWEFKNTTKKFCKTDRVETFFPKRRQKIQNRFFLDCLKKNVFGRFSVRTARGVQKLNKTKTNKQNLTLVLIWSSTHPHPPTTGHRFYFGGPLTKAT
jgi:hypothetical protein